MGKVVEKIHKICPQCGKEYWVRPCEDKRYIYCSVECRMKSKRTYKICGACGKEFYVYGDRKDKQNYCSVECRSSDSTITKICKGCGKEFTTWKKQQNRYTYCSIDCRVKDKNTEYHCDYCGKAFTVLKSKIERNKTGVFCSHKCSTDANVFGSIIKCKVCGKEVYKTKAQIEKGWVFCSSECAHEDSKRLITHTCCMCYKEYTRKASQRFPSKFCSNSCKNKWQSIYNIGENNPIYSSVTMQCEFCGKKIKVEQHKIKSQIHHFCSYDCTRNFYRIIKNRTEKQRIADYNVSRNAIKYIKPSLTSPHRKILSVLNGFHIYLNIEKLIEYYRLDIYLPQHRLAIEINGDYWHCSPIRYDSVKYKRQSERISTDKAKHTYVKNKYGFEILYLWERDIERNIEMCSLLILEYIRRNGILENYHSFNYHIDDDGCLSLNQNIILPFQERQKEECRVKIG